MKNRKLRNLKLSLVLATLSCVSINSDAGSSCLARPTGAVFVSSNSATTNSVHMYSVSNSGSLSEVTGSPFPVLENSRVAGFGSGPGASLSSDPLASQHSLIVDQRSRLLFVVNAGSGSVSSFKILKDRLVAADTKPSGGYFPVSLTFKKGILYVLNSGNTANIQGFSVDCNGRMTPISGSNIPLPYTGNFPLGIQGQPQIPQFPSQISFSPDGKQLLVLGKEGPDLRLFGFPDTIPPAGVQGPGHMFVYSMKKGTPKGAPTSYTFPLSPCTTCENKVFMKEPFAFTFVGHYVVVVEFFGNSSNGPSIFVGSAASSFALGNKGTLKPISVSVPNNQGGVCWISAKGNRIYVTNNVTDNLSQYSINSRGVLKVVNPVAAVVGPGMSGYPDEAFPLDNAIGNQGRNLYQLTPGPSGAPSAQIHEFSIDAKTGDLTLIGKADVGMTPLNGQMGMDTIDFSH